mmetsp:Transcript_85982/g.170689  ORF Transcript_85982/g.170689 Transcript_85982/m.170689 type:complete len:88 (+) Transcript_85982:161-424(+)
MGHRTQSPGKRRETVGRWVPKHNPAVSHRDSAQFLSFSLIAATCLAVCCLFCLSPLLPTMQIFVADALADASAESYADAAIAQDKDN